MKKAVVKTSRTYIFGYTTKSVKAFVKKRAKKYKTISKYITHLVKQDQKVANARN